MRIEAHRCTDTHTGSPQERVSLASPLQYHFIHTKLLLWWLNIFPVQGFNYWALEHHKGVWLEAKPGEWAFLAGWWANLAASVLAAMHKAERFQVSSVPSLAPEQSREELWGLAEGSPGCASKQLPPWLQWIMMVLEVARIHPHSWEFLLASLSSEIVALTQTL